MPIFDLDLFEGPVVEADRVSMLLLPLLSDLLLLDHDLVGSLLVALVPFLGL